MVLSSSTDRVPLRLITTTGSPPTSSLMTGSSVNAPNG